MLAISPLTSFILVLREKLVARLVISDILSSIFLILALYNTFFKNIIFTASLSLRRSTGTGTNLSNLKNSIYLLYFCNFLCKTFQQFLLLYFTNNMSTENFFKLFNHKNFFRLIWNIAFCQIVFIF